MTDKLNGEEGMSLEQLLQTKSEETEVVQKSPLELAKERKEMEGSGIEIKSAEYQEDGHVERLRSNFDTEEHRESINKSMEELDGMIAAAKTVQLSRPITDQVDMVNVISAVSDIAKKGEISDANIAGVGGLIEGIEPVDGVEGEEAPVQKKKIERDPRFPDLDTEAIVNILIDKTGTGTTNIQFTDDEKEKIHKSQVIKIKEVTELQLNTCFVEKTSDSYLSMVKNRKADSLLTPVLFPASRFRGYMRGLGFGELSNLALSTTSKRPDVLHKRFSIIYDNMVDTNVGQFADYDDFLKKFAYIDMFMAIYGMACSTFPEEDTLPLNCRVKKCMTGYDFKYVMRSLIAFDKFGPSALAAIKEIIEAKTLDQNLDVFANSPVQKYKRVELPVSGFLVDFGFASAYEYINGIAEIIDKYEPKTEEEVDEDPTMTASYMNALRLLIVRGIYEPLPDGTYRAWTSNDDLMSVMDALPINDINLISTINDENIEAYNPVFTLKNVKCPKCGTITPELEVPIESLVFQRYQGLRNTELDLGKTLYL